MNDPYTLLELPGITSALDRTEKELRNSVQAELPLLTTLARHLIDAGGKRIRPSLAIASAQILEENPPPPTKKVILGGVAVELVHQGSLYHDDVMDSAKTRRSVQSVNEKWGNREAILAGDYLLARASEIAADLGAEVAGLLASTIAALCEGQLLEVDSAHDLHRTEESYMASIVGKTGALLSASAQIGAIVAAYPQEVIKAVAEFGKHYGVAFQIVDDLLDVMSTEKDLGKPAGNDMVEGVYTLPVIRTLRSGNGQRLENLLKDSLTKETQNKALEIVRNDDSIGTTIDTALLYTDKARDSLSHFPETPTSEILKSTCDLLSQRVTGLRS